MKKSSVSSLLDYCNGAANNVPKVPKKIHYVAA